MYSMYTVYRRQRLKMPCNDTMLCEHQNLKWCTVGCEYIENVKAARRQGERQRGNQRYQYV